ncbi:hypothetical protein SH528x_005537 [Novipirellula sp. SH528]|uniref:hypothetical protein n=1 Tax=Novipirellula sp. SH528 TaxID=3454466 RepID=UPI003FA0E5B0
MGRNETGVGRAVYYCRSYARQSVGLRRDRDGSYAGTRELLSALGLSALGEEIHAWS